LEAQEESSNKLNKMPGKNFIKRAKIVFSGKLGICYSVLANISVNKKKNKANQGD
jgi:hypothetical protein